MQSLKRLHGARAIYLLIISVTNIEPRWGSCVRGDYLLTKVVHSNYQSVGMNVTNIEPLWGS